MRRSFREWVIYVLSILFAAAPFVFGLVRRLETGYDYRLLWMAFASALGAVGIMVSGKGHGKRRLRARAAAIFVSAMLFTGITALLLGATSAPGIWGIGFIFGACWAASYALNTLSRPHRHSAT